MFKTLLLQEYVNALIHNEGRAEDYFFLPEAVTFSRAKNFLPTFFSQFTWVGKEFTWGGKEIMIGLVNMCINYRHKKTLFYNFGGIGIG